MVAVKRQTAWTTEVAEPSEIQAAQDRRKLLRQQTMAACRQVALTLGYDRCAAELDAEWGPEGRGVSATFLRAALQDQERSNFRHEWIYWFAEQSEVVADLLLEAGGRGKPKKTPEEELRDLKELMRRELGQTANKLIRKAETL